MPVVGSPSVSRIRMDADPSCGYCLIMSTAFSTAALMSVAERKENVTNECNLVKLGWKSRMSVIVFKDLAIENCGKHY